MRTRYRGSDTLLPVRGRKHNTLLTNPSDCWFRYLTPCEGTETSVIATTFVTVGLGLDTFLPVRGRKRNKNSLTNSCFRFRCLTPREGTETA